MRRHGYTLIELVVVIAVAGVLAAVVAPRFSREVYDTTGYYHRVQSVLQFARKAAVAERRNVCAAIAATSVTLTRATAAGAATACTVSLLDPSTGQAFALTTPTGVTLAASTANFTFDSLGRASTAGTVTVNGDGSYVITIEAETGFVH